MRREMANPEAAPNPGHGYIVHEKLGEGHWKVVYRAVVRGEWEDRALLRYKRRMSPEELVKDLRPTLRLSARPPANVARPYDVFIGDDGEAYFVEELLYQPLNRLAPVAAGERFLRIARDLFTGLGGLHAFKLVHRDLKLDNCGVDFADRGKIFDLGLVTTEGSSVRGTILSRAPELLQEPYAPHTRPADVWALGAVLFALRSGGNYPFVTRSEAEQRPIEGPDREKFDRRVLERAKEHGTEGRLQERVAELFPRGPRELLTRILSFHPGQRPTAEEAGGAFDELLRSWMRPVARPAVGAAEATARDIRAYLSGILEGRVGISTRLWHRAVEAVNSLEGDLDPEELGQLRELVSKVNERRQDR
jgi:serine/threonine protein kinase